MKAYDLLKRLRNLLLIGLLAFGATTVFVGCEDDDGPLEEAAENVEEGAEEAGDELEEATD